MQGQQYTRPLPTGTRLIYYNKAQCREMEAVVKRLWLCYLMGDR
jgi:hypothetical protein